MKTVEKLGIYGGTFSPIHNGHIRAAEKFLSDIELDRTADHAGGDTTAQGRRTAFPARTGSRWRA